MFFDWRSYYIKFYFVFIMLNTTIVIDNPTDWEPYLKSEQVITFELYIIIMSEFLRRIEQRKNSTN